MTDLKSLIQTNYPSMTKKEKKIADYLLKHSKKAKNKSISEIATACGVVESTVFLFAKKIGLSGFKELTVLLANSRQDFLFDGITEDDDYLSITKKVIESNIHSLTSTYKFIDLEQLKGAVKLLNSSEKTVFFALGGSTPIALDAYHKFLRTPLDVEFNLEYHMQLLRAGKLTKNSCAFIVSHSGENPDILRITDILQKNRVPIIAITSFTNTSLAKAATYTFISTTEELKYKDAGIYTRRLAQMLLVDILFTLVMIAEKDASIPYLEKLQAAIYSTK